MVTFLLCVGVVYGQLYIKENKQTFVALKKTSFFGHIIANVYVHITLRVMNIDV